MDTRDVGDEVTVYSNTHPQLEDPTSDMRSSEMPILRTLLERPRNIRPIVMPKARAQMEDVGLLTKAEAARATMNMCIIMRRSLINVVDRMGFCQHTWKMREQVETMVGELERRMGEILAVHGQEYDFTRSSLYAANDPYSQRPSASRYPGMMGHYDESGSTIKGDKADTPLTTYLAEWRPTWGANLPPWDWKSHATPTEKKSKAVISPRPK